MKTKRPQFQLYRRDKDFKFWSSLKRGQILAMKVVGVRLGRTGSDRDGDWEDATRITFEVVEAVEVDYDDDPWKPMIKKGQPWKDECNSCGKTRTLDVDGFCKKCDSE